MSAPVQYDMGPASFMWPSDRVWSASADKLAPCGSEAGAGNRTEFPLSGGQVALIAQDNAWDLELSIAHMDNPTSNEDFDLLIDVLAFRDLDVGHTCVTIDDSHPDLKVGDKATLQIKYISDYNTPRNHTHYACADIVYVEDGPSIMSASCFNATVPDTEDQGNNESDKPKDSDKSDTGSKGENANKSQSDSDSSSPSSGGRLGGLSDGAIAGIVIGAVSGVVGFAAAALFFRRKRNQKQSVKNERDQKEVESVKEIESGRYT